jgi:hypothetical protein
MFSRKLFPLACALALAVCSLFVAHAAGGELAGTVTDANGAVVVGATVTVTDATTNKSLTAVTDTQGHYKVSVPPGTYNVSVAAKGFNTAQHARVEVAEGKSATADVRLEVSVEATTVNVIALKTGAGGSDAVYLALRSGQEFNSSYATVNNLTLKRDAGTFMLKSGELYFAAPVEGRTVGAVFIGDGEFTMTPPTEAEKRSLAIFTKEPSITEQFTQLILHFTDKTFDEVKQASGVTMGAGGAQAARARDLYHDNQQLLRRELRTNADLRTLIDLYNPQRPGYFNAFINGKRYNKLIFALDPMGNPGLAPEEVMLFSYGDSDFGWWTSFHLADEYQNGTASSSQDTRQFDIAHHQIDATISGTKITATDQLTMRALIPGTRVLPFDLFGTLRVQSVQDEQGRAVAFIQEDKDRDSDFAVILPQGLNANQTFKLTVQYAGEGALRDSGGGNYTLLPRSTWYPNGGGAFGDRATFDVTYHYPKNFMLIGTGALAGPETQAGDQKMAEWTSGQTELAVAGFNFGRFKKKELADKETGLNIEFYANTEVPDEVRQMQVQIDEAERQGVKTGTTLGSISTTQMADQSISEAKNSVLLYNTFFGKTPFTRIAMSQQPFGGFGQAWPTLVYMPYTAFLDATQRVQMFGSRGGTDNFWRYVAPHEVAHQWWGHTVGWSSYRDQWMSEGFAEFSASLYVQYVRHEPDKFIEFWEEQRRRITEATPQTKDIKPYTIGPVTQGFRLSNAKTRAAYQFLVYPKGAYILHMLRMMMREPEAQNGDQKFMAMMHDFIKTHYNKDVSTEDLKQAVEQHMTPQMNMDGDGRMDWFFNEYVYGTEMPSYKFEYQISGSSISGRITQAGVADNFRMLVPIYLDFGNGWRPLASVRITGNKTIEIPPIQLPAAPKRAAVAAYNDVLALNIENKKM